MRTDIFNDFYTNFKTKNEADSHLTGLILMTLVERRAPTVTIVEVTPGKDEPQSGACNVVQRGVAPNAAAFSYKVRCRNHDYPVSIIKNYAIRV